VSAEAEMRAVIEHAAEKLAAAKDSKVVCDRMHIKYFYSLPADVLMAFGYAEGVLRLLASYLKVDPKRTERIVTDWLERYFPVHKK